MPVHVNVPVERYLASLSSTHSRRTQTSALRAVSKAAAQLAGRDLDLVDYNTVDWSQMRPADASLLRTFLLSSYRPATVNRLLAALRGVTTQMWLAGLITETDVARMKFALRSVAADHHDQNPTDRLVSHDDLMRMFVVLAADQRVIARRDAALLAILGMGALRRSEAVSLNLADWDPNTQELLVLNGKGGFKRKVWLHGGAVDAVQTWLSYRGVDPGPLLCVVSRTGTVAPQQRMSSHALYKRVKQLAVRAGVKELTPHDFRRKVITDLLEFGDDLNAVRQLAGHASVSTTARYDRRGEAAAKKASQHIVLPYLPPN